MAKTGQAKQIIENRRGDTFDGWLARILLEAGDIPIAQIAELALREGQNSNPLYRVHKLRPAPSDDVAIFRVKFHHAALPSGLLTGDQCRS